MSTSFLDALEPRKHLSATPAAVPIRLASGGDGSTFYVVALTPAPMTRLKGDTLYVDGGTGNDTVRARVVGDKVYFVGTAAHGVTLASAGATIALRGPNGTTATAAGGDTIFTPKDAATAGATFAYAADGKTLTLTDAGGAVSVINVLPAASGDVRLGSPTALGTGYDLASIQKIVVSTGAGNDTVDLTAIGVPAEVRGGAGDDVISTGVGADTLYGDNGNDEISGGGGADLVAGGNGNDTLRARSGPDTLLGQGGRDTLYAFAAEAVINGGAGTDTVSLAAAPDAIAGAEKTASGSQLRITPVRVSPADATVTLRRRGDRLALNAGVVLPTSGYGVDWDLTRNARGEVVADATIYIVNVNVGSGQAFTSYQRSFDLGDVFAGRTASRGYTVTLTQAGTPVVTGSTTVGRDFTSAAFTSADDDNAGSAGSITIVAAG